MELPKRKKNRLTEYSYDAPNAYFITICTNGRVPLFWVREEPGALTEYGKIVDEAIRSIPVYYPVVSLDRYVVMPNHVHLLLQIHSDPDGHPIAAPTVSQMVNQFKGTVSKKIGFSPWQKGFYDHVIRGETDYREIWKYIEENPLKWSEDQLYNGSM